MGKPLIVQVVMAEDWAAAFRLVWAESLKSAAIDMGMAVAPVEIVMDDLASWPERRAACLHLGRRCAEDHDLPDLACAWATLGIDPAWPKDDEPAPERTKAFLPVYFALGDAIADDASLLDDDDFCRTVMGWRFVEAFGIGGPLQDPIVLGREVGAGMEFDRDELLRWAQKWAHVS